MKSNIPRTDNENSQIVIFTPKITSSTDIRVELAKKYVTLYVIDEYN